MALSANRTRHRRNLDGLKKGQITGVDSDEFYEGGMVSWSAAAATILPSADTSLTRFAGVCTERVTTGSSNTTKIRYEYGHEEWYELSGLVTSQEGMSVYVSDDETVTDYAGSSNKIRVGTFRNLETLDGTAGIWVYIDGQASGSVGEGRVVTPNGAPEQQWNHAGEGVLTARGVDGVSVAGTIYYGGWIPDFDMTVTNMNVLMGSTVGTDEIIAGIYTLGGTLLKSSDLAGLDMADADTYFQCPLTATQAILGGTEYLMAIQLEGNTDGVQRHQVDFRAGTGRTGKQTGSFGTMAAISSVATTFTTAYGPLFWVD